MWLRARGLANVENPAIVRAVSSVGRSLMQPVDQSGPTAQRIAKSGGDFDLTGRSRSTRRYTFLDDALGSAWKRQILSALEYAALRRYALHWLAGGLQGPLGSVDLN